MRYVIVRDEEGKVLAMGRPEDCAIVEYSDRDRGLFEGFYQQAVREGDALTIYRNADRVFFLNQLDGIPFVEIGRAG